MKASFISKLGHRVTVEPIGSKTEEELLKKTRQIMRKRGIVSDIKLEK